MTEPDLFELGWSDEEIFRFLVEEAGWDEDSAHQHIAAMRGHVLDDVIGREEANNPTA